MSELLRARVHTEIAKAMRILVATGAVGAQEAFERCEKVAFADESEEEHLAGAMVD